MVAQKYIGRTYSRRSYFAEGCANNRPLYAFLSLAVKVAGLTLEAVKLQTSAFENFKKLTNCLLGRITVDIKRWSSVVTVCVHRDRQPCKNG